MKTDPRLADWMPELTAWRRDFHAHPELGYEEHRTAALVAERLASFGLEVSTGVGGTGVVGTLRNGPGNHAISLRADMDALPMTEANEFAHRSTTPGRMHACGHDGHTTTLLAAARLLAARRNFSGTVHFVFQPAEEGGAGAARMIEDGLFERFPCDAMFGAHNDPTLPLGTISASPGTVNAAADELTITITGRGGHAARPHATIDPVLAGAQIILGLQTIVSRRVAPLDSCVVSICQFHAGSAHNVIPGEAILNGTVRTMTEAVQDQVAREIPALIHHLAAASGATADVIYDRGYPPVVNDADAATRLRAAASSLFGDDRVIADLPASMGAEDFSYFAHHRPACFFRIGQNDGTNGTFGLHHPRYDFNDHAIPIGASLFAALVEQELPA